MSRKKAGGGAHADHDQRGSRYKRQKIWNIVLGVFFFILGVIGILIPVMPQLIFFFLSLVFFSRVSPRLRRAVRRYRKRHPKLENAYQSWRRRARDEAARDHPPRPGDGQEHRGEGRGSDPQGIGVAGC